MMKKIFIVLISLWSFAISSQEAKPSSMEKDLEVVVGKDLEEKLNFTPSRQMLIGNEAILSITPNPATKTIFLKGLKQGETTLTLFDNAGEVKAKYNIKVTTNTQSKVVFDLREFLGDVEGLEIGVKGEFVYLGGKIIVPSDIGRVVLILNKYPDVLNLVELSPQTQVIIAKKMQDEIQKNNMKNVTVRVLNNTFWIEGIVESEAQRDRAQVIAEAYLPDNIESLARRTNSVQKSTKSGEIIRNFLNINKKSAPAPVPKLVKIVAQFVELSKDYTRIFGFKWAPTLGGDGGQISFGKTSSGGVTTNSNGTLAGTIANLFPKLASAKSAGYARVIQSGVVITKDKKQAKIVKNSIKPFAIGTGEFTRADKAESGFNLDVTPAILPEEKIDLSIGLSVSSTVGDPPESLNNTISTSLVIKSKESAVIGGVVVNKSSTDFDRNPPFGKDQVENGSTLFSFLKSKSYGTTKNQFVVFVTPEIIESASQGTEEIKKKFKRRQR